MPTIHMRAPFLSDCLNMADLENTIRSGYKEFMEQSKMENLDRRQVFGMAAAGLAAGIPWLPVVFAAGLLTELAVLWVVSLRVLTKPRRVTL